MAGEYLPPVVTRLTGDIADIIAKVEEAKAAIKSLGNTSAEVNIKFAVDTRSLARARTYARQLASTFPDGVIPVKADVNLASFAAASAAAKGLAAANTTAANGTRFFWGLTGATILHLVGVTFELLAVLIPATVAAGALGAVASQGAENAYVHMLALRQATDATHGMFNQTISSVLGFGNALYNAQVQAKPEVYQAMGSAILIAKNNMHNFGQTGLSALDVVDSFLAKLTYEFTHGSLGGSVHGLFANMVSDLTLVGQLFGNLIHLIANLAIAGTGVGRLLIGTFSGLLSILTAITGNPIGRWFTTLGFAMHQAIFFGGLLSRALGALVLWAARGALAVAGLALRLGAAGLAGAAAGASEKLATFASFLKGPWGTAAVVAAIGIGFLVHAMLNAKDATQQFIAAQNAAISHTSNLQILGKITGDLASNQAKLAAATQYLTTAQGVFNHSSFIVVGFLHAMTAQQANLMQSFLHVGAGAQYLANTYHTSLVGAMALATQAGVHLNYNILGQSEGATILREKIAALVAGYTAMGQPMNVVGKDMSAIGIQAMLQSSNLDKLNGAWDAFIANMTGGTTDLAQMVVGIANIGQVASTTNTKLFHLGDSGAASFTLGIQKAAKAMANITTQKGAQAWQNFNQVVASSDQQLADWLRTAGTEGVLSAGNFTTAIRAMVGQLLPFAAHSRTATAILSGLAQEANGPSTSSFKVLKQWVDGGQHSMSALAKIIETTTAKMGNMSQVAQNLGAVVQSSIINTMANAKLSVDNVGKATLTFTQALQHNSATSHVVQQDYRNLVYVLTQVTGNNKLANTIAQTYARSMGDDSTQAYKFNVQTHNLGQALSQLPRNIPINIVGNFMWGTPVPGGVSGLPSGLGRLFQHAAGYRVPGYGGGDTHPALLEGGEAVVPKHLVGGIAGYLKSHGVPGFASGGFQPSWTPSFAGSPVPFAAEGGGEILVTSVVYLDSKQIFKGTQRQARRYNRRNGPRGSNTAFSTA